MNADFVGRRVREEEAVGAAGQALGLPRLSARRGGPLTRLYLGFAARPTRAEGSRRLRPSQVRAPSMAARGQGREAADPEEGRRAARGGPGHPPEPQAGLHRDSRPGGWSPRAARWPNLGSQTGQPGLGRTSLCTKLGRLS